MMSVFKKVTEFGDTRGLGLVAGQRFDCVDCNKKLRVVDEWPPKENARGILYTWKLQSDAVVSICRQCKEKRMGFRHD